MVFKALRAAALPLTVLGVAAVLLSGCASVLTGTALRDPRVDPRAVNASMLDPGPFPTKPAPPLGVAGNERAGRTAEAHRMSEAVLLPFEIDATLTEQEPSNTPFTDAAQLGVGFIAGFPGLGPHDMIAASKSSARAPRSTVKLGNAVLRFASPEEAAGATDYMATHIARGPLDVGGGTSLPARQSVPIPDRPDTRMIRSDNDGWSDVFAFTTYGVYVLVQAITADTGEAGIALALNAIDKQRPALDGFVPTPVDQLANLPVDPTGLLARTLPAPAGADNSRLGVYGPHGALNFMSSPPRTQQLFAAAGLQAASFETGECVSIPRRRGRSPYRRRLHRRSGRTQVHPDRAHPGPARGPLPAVPQGEIRRQRRRPTTACWPPTATSSRWCRRTKPTHTRKPPPNT